MKRFGILLVTLSFTLLLTGCGEKNLTCTRTEEDTKEKITFTFNSKKVLTGGTLQYDIKVEDTTTLESGKQTLQEYFERAFGDQDGFDLDIKDNGKDTVTVVLKFDADKLSAALGEEIDEAEANLKEIKSEMEKEDYTCR